MNSPANLVQSFFTPRWDKRAIIAALVLALIATAFWTGSRYPALNEKAALGSDNSIAGIAFDQVFPVSSSDSVLQQITANSLNWAYTNKQGMSFGLLFAASVITLLQLFRRKHFEGRFANTLLGVSMGAPLGVCVNCAVPIAMGAQSSGTRTETTLAMMFSSPTLNVVVLGMAIALFPPWMVALKVGATLLFIVIAVPLSVRWFGPVQQPNSSALGAIAESASLPAELLTSSTESSQITSYGSWFSASFWVAREMLRNLWFIARMTLPFMALAGILGASAVTMLPWESLAGAMPQDEMTKFSLLVGIALLGTFLPVPIAFDIVICSILLAAGVEARYVATLLVTLGIFSIYPALQIGRTISARLSLGLFFMVTTLGVIVGLAGDTLAAWETERQSEALEQGLMSAPQGPEAKAHLTAGHTADDVLAMLAPHRITGEEIPSAHAQLKIESTSLQTVSNQGTQLFNSVYGQAIGINEPDNISALRFIEPLISNRAIASGDVHDDGWPDLLLTSEAGLSLYANIGGTKFVRQEIHAPELNDAYILRAALVDLDGDADLDIVVGTFEQGIFFIPNHQGSFESGATQLPGYQKGAVTGAFAFGDIDRDGDLDAIVGNRSVGNNPLNRSLSAAQNYYLIREDGTWTSRPLPGPEGETLSILLSDLNSDGWLDVFVGNDYIPPDHLLLSDGKGSLQLAKKNQLIDGGTARWTMSFSSADINGDLIPELYVGNISGRRNAPPRDPEQECRFETDAEKTACVDWHTMSSPFLPARQRSDAAACNSISDPELKEGCMVIALTSPAMSKGGTGKEALGDLCQQIPAQWPSFRSLCVTRQLETLSPLSKEESAQTISSNKRTNVLLMRDGVEGRYADQAVNMGVDDAGWTWNARFADVDLDGLQDLYVVNGHTIARKRYDHRLFLNKGNRFEDAAVEAGVASGIATTSYTYLDVDRDGDLDIVTVPLIGPVKLLKNEAAGDGRHAVEFELRDQSGNPYAIGATVTIHYGADGTLAQMREVQLSGGFASFDEPLVHFGLGENETIHSLTIHWPDGDETTVSSEFSANTRYRISRLGKQ